MLEHDSSCNNSAFKIKNEGALIYNKCIRCCKRSIVILKKIIIIIRKKLNEEHHYYNIVFLHSHLSLVGGLVVF